MAGARIPGSNPNYEYPIIRVENAVVNNKNEKKSHDAVLLRDESILKRKQEDMPKNQQRGNETPEQSTPTHFIHSNSTSNSAIASSSGICQRSSTESPTTDPSTNLTPEQRENLNCLLAEAVCANETEEVRRLLDAGADVNFWSEFAIPLLDAAAGGNPSIVSLLLQRGADINTTTHRGENSLHFAAVSDTTGKCLSLLIEAGGDVECTNIKGDTPMHFAASVQNEVSVRTLLDAGARKSVKNKKGRTPFSLAVDEPIVNLLQP